MVNVPKWILLGAGVGLAAGLASALFLWMLDIATARQVDNPSLLYFLPVAGVAVGALYHHFGKSVAGGNNLLLDRIHDPNASVPFVMAPLILLTTVLTHLFGGSAGREGTAVQMGGSLADLFVQPFGLTPLDRRILIMTGISAGFGAVFGTPWAGAIFGLEVLSVGRIRYQAVIPCVVASLVGDYICRGVGIHHTTYQAPLEFTYSLTNFGWVLLSGVLFAGASSGFSFLTHALQRIGREVTGAYYVRPFVGGLLIIGLTFLVGNRDYNGLSLPLIGRSFTALDIPSYAFLLKILFTAVTLGFGFKGGEVTPLFCIGATLGNALALMTHQDPGLFAALGFVAVFAGAANTPLACAVLGVELFGVHLAVPLAVACFVSYLFSGHRGIYTSQLAATEHSGETFHIRKPCLFRKGK